MANGKIREQLVHYLTDAHSIEEQALQQLKTAPGIAGDVELARAFEEHLIETEGHERLVRERLEAHGEKPSKLKDVVMRAGGTGFTLFARFQPDTPGKLMAHAFSYEHLELAAYELLIRVAERAGDPETVEAGSRIRDQERTMIERLAGGFDRSVDASLRDLGEEATADRLRDYLADAHAIEGQAIQLLERGPKIAGDTQIAEVYSQHLGETRDQRAAVAERLDALGGSSSLIKDAGMRMGALNWGMFFQAQPDTPGKLLAFAFAFEHLEIGGYEQLKRVAERAGDHETVATAERILGQERAAAEKMAGLFDRGVDASLEAQGATG